jgi:arabinofuranosyltransferase
MSRVRWVWLVLFVVVLLRTAWLGDDALITLRTVLNLTHGYGPVFNAAERVQTFTHPLWMGLLTLAYLMVGNVFYAAFALSILTSTLVFVVVLRSARTFPQLIIAGGVLLASRAFIDYSTSGLENPLTSLLAVLTLTWAFSETRGPRWLIGVWLGVSAAYLTRPDAVMLVLPAAIAATIRSGPWRPALRSLLIGLIPALAWSMFAVIYYGFAFPNTAYAKLGTNIEWHERLQQGFIYLLDSLNRDPVTLTTIGAAVVVASIERSRAAWLTLAGIVTSLLYVVWIGGDFMTGRFLSVPLLLAVWMIVRTERISEPEWRPVLIVLAVAAVASPRLPIMSNSSFNASDSISGIVDERGVYFPQWGLVRADRLAFTQPEWPRAEGRSKPEYVLDTCGLMGQAGLEWGPKTYLLDECALADPLLARLPAVWKEEWRPGHYRRMIPDGYRESVALDTNRIRDAGLAEYYHALRVIVRDRPLLSAERLKTIWWMARGKYDARIDRRFYAFGGEVLPLESLSAVVPDGTPWDGPGSHPFRGELAVTCKDQPSRRVLDITLDSDDRYRLTFLKKNRIMGAVVVDVVPRDQRKPGLASHIVTIPERPRRLGFDTIVIVEVAGDEKKAVGHLLLDGEEATALELGRRFGASAR